MAPFQIADLLTLEIIMDEAIKQPNKRSNDPREVIVVIGAGLIGQAIARRVGSGKHTILADLHRENADATAEIMSNAGFV